MAAKLTPITTGWSFTQIGGGQGTKNEEWLETAHFPTTVHVELIEQKIIPEPFIGLNEWDVQWVGEADWAFKTTFDISTQELDTPCADLVFEGLDTFATVTLNGAQILESSNQFVSHVVPVKQHLKSGQNELRIHFESAFLKGRDIEKAHSKLNLWNGDSSRLHVRKAQYNYGWDWGPVLMTVGPWRPIYLRTYTTSVSSVDSRARVSENLDCTLAVAVALSSPCENAQVEFELTGVPGTLAKEVVVAKDGAAMATFELGKDQVELWWPVGYGKQSLYNLSVKVVVEGTVLDTKTQKVAFRRAQIVQEKLVDQPGLTFLFEINNVRIFCGGSNWIPADSFLTTVTDERYRAWLQLLVDGNQNMIRVWGGGIYEPDIFYDLCDEMGILVWQDFMFGCGQYPAYDSFLDSVKLEAEQNVKRLRSHPSLVIFAGNNEDYQIAESLKLELDYSDETSDFRKTNFPARHIYERVLPEIVQKHSDVFYHRSSPYSGQGQPTTDKTLGDLHQWNVWHGSQEPWHNWDILAGRFVSEFGMEGYPNIRTVDHWVGQDRSERYPQSRVMNSHNKADGFERRLELYLVENFKHAFDIESYAYYTQIMQAETLASAYRLWRRNWKGQGHEYTAGALVWQLNDCWPTTSWAIADYFLRPKPSYFTISRELRPFTVGMTRKDVKTFTNERSAANFTVETRLEIWGTNSTLQQKKAKLDVRCFDLLDQAWKEGWSEDVVLQPNACTELWQGQLPGQSQRSKMSDVPRTIVVSARLLDEGGEVLGRYSNWPEPFKFIKFPSPEQVGLKIVPDASGESVELSCQRPIKGIVLDAEGDDVKWSDQAIDLVPGDPQVVRADGLKGRNVLARYLGDGTA